MNLLNRFEDLVRNMFSASVNADDRKQDDDSYPDDLAGLASVLSLTIEPRAEFVDSLGQILSSTDSPPNGVREPVRPGVFRWRKVALRVLYAVIALALMGLLVVFVPWQD